jgi:hypothetical protein
VHSCAFVVSSPTFASAFPRQAGSALSYRGLVNIREISVKPPSPSRSSFPSVQKISVNWSLISGSSPPFTSHHQLQNSQLQNPQLFLEPEGQPGGCLTGGNGDVRYGTQLLETWRTDPFMARRRANLAELLRYHPGLRAGRQISWREYGHLSTRSDTVCRQNLERSCWKDGESTRLWPPGTPFH